MKKSSAKMGQIDFMLFATVVLLVTIGVLMVFSASSWFALVNYDDPDYFFKKQMMWAVIGFIFMAIAIKIDYHKYKQYTGLIMIITIILLLAVFVFPPIKGARRWIPLGIANFQPSEIAKYVIVLFMAKSLDLKGEKIKTFSRGVFPYLLISGFYAGLILMEPNLSIASIIMIVTVIILFAAGARFKHILAIGGTLVAAVGVLILIAPYRLERALNFMDPFAKSQDEGYQLVQSLLALGSGGVTGAGIGQSRQKCLYIPEPHTDFIFSIIGEELGLIGVVFIISLFLIFVWRGIKVAVTAKDMYGTLLAIGTTSVIAVQAIINIAVVTGSMPVTGVPLPFISYGGSALVINMFAMGILLNISRQTTNKN
ncbi:stage V sporulation protein E [Clostridium sp.]|uniref:stage V sporulation protein E n=1 Tax=Clostridium sp. TaxID=1506 RepID=UPI003D6D33AE